MVGGRTRRSWSAGSQMRQRQTTGTAAAAGRPISVRFCESAATSHSLTSFTELNTRPPSRPTAFDTVDTSTSSVLPKIHAGRENDVKILFPRNFLATNRCNGIWETKRHNRHNGLLPAPTFTELLRTCRLCCELVTDLLRGNWCNGFWSLYAQSPHYRWRYASLQ